MTGTIIFTIAIILVSVFMNRKAKKNRQGQPNTYKRPQSQPRQKTLEEIIREITSGLEQDKPRPIAPSTPAPSPQKQKDYSPYYSLEDTRGEETTIHVEDTEDVLATDDVADHHVHGKGFDEPVPVALEPVIPRFEVGDWRRAIIVSEILKRPEY